MIRKRKLVHIFVILSLIFLLAGGTATGLDSDGSDFEGQQITVHVIEESGEDVRNAEVTVIPRHRYFDRIDIDENEFFDFIDRGNFFDIISNDEFFNVVDDDRFFRIIDEERFKDQVDQDNFFRIVDIDEVDDILDDNRFHKDDDIVDRQEFIDRYVDDSNFFDIVDKKDLFSVVSSRDFFDDDVVDERDLMELVNQSNLSNRDQMNEDNVLDEITTSQFLQIVSENDFFDIVDEDEFLDIIDEDDFFDHVSLEEFLDHIDRRGFFIVVNDLDFIDEAVDEDRLLDEVDENEFFDVITTKQAFFDIVDEDDFFDDRVIDIDDFFDRTFTSAFFRHVDRFEFFQAIDKERFPTRETDAVGEASFAVDTGIHEIYVDMAGFPIHYQAVDVKRGQQVVRVVRLGQTPPSDGTGSDGQNGTDGTGGSGGDGQTPPTVTTDLSITGTTIPTSLQQNSQFNVTLRVQNSGSRTASNVVATIQAFGQTITSDSVSIPSRSSRTITVPVKVPSGVSGPVDINIEVAGGGDRDITTLQADVSDAQAYMTFSPQQAYAGQSVFVQGRITQGLGLRGTENLTARLYLGNQYVTTVHTDGAGFYRAYVKPELIGSYRIVLQGTGFTVAETLRVRPRVELGDLTLEPAEPFLGESSSACADLQISGEHTATATFSIDGAVETAKKVAEDGETCFSISPLPPGAHDVTIHASLEGATDSVSGQLRVKESKRDRITFDVRETERDGERFILLNVTNPSPVERSITARVRGLAPGWVEQPNRTVRVAAQTTKTVEFPVRAEQTGRYTASVEIGEGSNVTSRQVGLTVSDDSSGGIEWKKTVDTIFEYALKSLPFIIGLAFIFGIIAAVQAYRENKTPRSLEPRN